VTWIGRLIAVLDDRLNREIDGHALRRAAGVVALVIIVGVVATAAFAVERGLLHLPFGMVAAAIVATP